MTRPPSPRITPRVDAHLFQEADQAMRAREPLEASHAAPAGRRGTVG
jgi:hypothetical protein